MQQQQQQVATVVYMGGQAPVAASPTYHVGVQPTGVTSYDRRQSMGIGITLIISAILGFIFNSVELGVGLDYGFVWGVVGHGYWTGTMCIIAGGFAVAASRTATRSRPIPEVTFGLVLYSTPCVKVSFRECFKPHRNQLKKGLRSYGWNPWIVTLNVLCIISASLTCGEFIVGIMGATISIECYSCGDVRNTVIAMESLLAILAVVEAIAAIWGSAICCKAYCCCTTVTPTPVYYVHHYQTPTAMNTGMPTMSVLNQPATITMAAMGAQPYSYPHMQSAQMTMTPPSYGFYSNQGYVHSNPGPPQPYPSADPHKMTDKNPPEYTCNGTSS